MTRVGPKLAASILALALAACGGTTSETGHASASAAPRAEQWCGMEMLEQQARAKAVCAPPETVDCPRGTHAEWNVLCALDRDAQEKPACPAPVAMSAESFSDGERAAARTLYERGKEREEDGAEEEACAAYVRAVTILPIAPLVARVAACAARRGELAYAASCYRGVAAFDVPAEALPAWRQAREEAAAAVPALVARLGSLRVAMDAASGAEVSLDGAHVTKESLAAGVVVDPGGHRVVAVGRDGNAVGVLEVDVAEGEQKSSALRLVKTPCKSPGR